MNFKILYKGLMLALMNSFVLGANFDLKGDCKEIRDFCGTDPDIKLCKVDDNGKVYSLSFTNFGMTEECFKKISTYNSVTTINYIQYATNFPGYDFTFNKYPLEMTNFTNLEELNYGYSAYKDIGRNTIPYGGLNLPKLKRLSLSGILITPSTISEIANLTNLEELELYFTRRDDSMTYKSFKNLNKLSRLVLVNEDKLYLVDLPEMVYNSAETLKYLAIRGHTINNVSDRISSLKNLTYLDLSNNSITSILSKLNGLNKLEYLNLSYNDISEEIPEFINDFKNLNTFYINENKNITGKTLTNDQLNSCSYDFNNDLCIAKEMNCIGDYIGLKPCQSSEDNIPISTTGQCGEQYGKCPNGLCCSRYGWCGLSDLHCNVSDGCQSKYGYCN